MSPGKYFNTIGANTFQFYEDVNDVVQYEPNEASAPSFSASSPPSASRRASRSRPTRG